MTQSNHTEQHNAQRDRLFYFGLAAALPWAAVIVLRFLYLMIPQPPGSDRPSPGLWQVFSGFSKPFEIGSASFPILPIIGGVLAILIFTWIGKLFLQCFELYLPKYARRSMAFFCGLSIVGITLEPLAMLHWLYWPLVWFVLFVLIVLFWRLSFLHNRRSHPSSVEMDDARVLRRALQNEASDRYERSLITPRGAGERLFHLFALGLITLITFLTFYHALLYPESYWDSLILYLGYARMTFLEHGFPAKVVAQVGIGLGANYPHLYSLLGSAISTMFGHWSPIYQQLMAPLAGLATTVLIYHTVLHITRRKNHALAAALLFRAIPYGIAYNIYASDYAIVMLLTAAFLYIALLYVETGLWGYLAILTLVTATGAHLNYLMNAMWGVWLITILVAHMPMKQMPLHYEVPMNEDGLTSHTEPSFLRVDPRLSYHALFRSRRFWTISLVGICLSLPWHIRNWIVTGNPVYAFFPDIFGGKNINPEVLRSAFLEWKLNGDGIGVIAEQLYGTNSILNKIRATWFYFFLWEHPWKVSPVFVAFGLPGLVFFFSQLYRQVRLRILTGHVRFGLVAVTFLFGMLFYFYFLADFYLYQIIPILPTIAIFIAFWPIGTAPGFARVLWYLLVLATAIMPGLAIALEGPKLPFYRAGDRAVTNEMWALRHPLIDPDTFYELKFPGEFEAIQFINQNLRDSILLTHDNRHLLYDPSIQLVHLDDWEIQKLYGVSSPDARADALRKMGIYYYLQIPMEQKHPINERLGMRELFNAGRLAIVFRALTDSGEDVSLYRITEGDSNG